jgi:serine/threonine protein kinase
MRGQTIYRRYKILEELSGGAFGTTYIAEDLGFQTSIKSRCVVKKFSPKDNNPNVLDIARRLFNEEALALQQLGRHDQIPQLLAYFEEEQQFYLVLELIEGENLGNGYDSRCFSCSPIRPTEKLHSPRPQAFQFNQKK